MLVEGVDTQGMDFYTEIVSIESKSCLTLNTQHLFDKQSVLTFTQKDSSTVLDIKGNIVKLDSCIKLPKGTNLSFYKCNKPKMSGSVMIDKNGNSSVILTTTIDNIYFSDVNTTFTIDVDSLITITPNACDQHITLTKDTDRYIDFVNCDTDFNKHGKTVTITQEPKNGVTAAVTYRDVGTINYYKKYTPNAGYVGLDKIKFTLSDGVNSSEEKTIFLKIK
jgi:hypothetical protein